MFFGIFPLEKGFFNTLIQFILHDRLSIITLLCIKKTNSRIL